MCVFGATKVTFYHATLCPIHSKCRRRLVRAVLLHRPLPLTHPQTQESREFLSCPVSLGFLRQLAYPQVNNIAVHMCVDNKYTSEVCMYIVHNIQF